MPPPADIPADRRRALDAGMGLIGAAAQEPRNRRTLTGFHKMPPERVVLPLKVEKLE